MSINWNQLNDEKNAMEELLYYICSSLNGKLHDLFYIILWMIKF